MKSPNRSSNTSGTPAAAAHATFKGRVAEPVVGSLFLRVFQDVIGLARFLELLFRVRIVGVAVGMKLFRLAAIGLLDLVRRGALGKPEHFVIVTFGHLGSP